MARAKRHYHIWQITHRCHKREFLFRFSKDRDRCLQWLYQAKKRYGLKILNYMVTSNHIHLLVADDGGRNVIPKSMQFIAGRTAQEFNQTRSIAVGSKELVDKVKSKLGKLAKGRDATETDEGYQLRESAEPYLAHFEAEKSDMGPENTYFGNITD